jgi:hypothetical protein
MYNQPFSLRTLLDSLLSKWSDFFFFPFLFHQDVLPIAQKLGERIFENCGSKLAPYVPQANYCGQKRSRDKLQDSRSHTKVAVCLILH